MQINAVSGTLPAYSLKNKGNDDPFKEKVADGNMELQVPGDREISICWKKSKNDKHN
ncbi:MAG: hypothetical protein ACTJHT_16215 [Sphingobacterium sp.]|uniref:hypothetical protein n=1 Tax=Sphingobacterium sp. JB170 TaxID=1434842 RepID=UPI00097F56EB|nr:hypothetical protein [Sphingobacterium sp. JB170]SJN47800.1 hypothetical protein FM107_16240 [Sphingobacterium sp. JB170]